MGANKVRAAAGALLLLLVWQLGVAAAAEAGRVSPAATARALAATAGDRYRATIGEHHALLAAVWEHAPDARRLVVVRDPADIVVRPAPRADETVDLSVPKDKLVAHLTTLLFPVIVRELAALDRDAEQLAELLEPTTYVLDLHRERGTAPLSGLRTVASGPGFELLRYDPSP